jgi:hypothetical protein
MLVIAYIAYMCGLLKLNNHDFLNSKNIKLFGFFNSNPLTNTKNI